MFIVFLHGIKSATQENEDAATDNTKAYAIPIAPMTHTLEDIFIMDFFVAVLEICCDCGRRIFIRIVFVEALQYDEAHTVTRCLSRSLVDDLDRIQSHLLSVCGSQKTCPVSLIDYRMYIDKRTTRKAKA
jgi:hypothetical protein